jgi:hypothetical protein
VKKKKCLSNLILKKRRVLIGEDEPRRGWKVPRQTSEKSKMLHFRKMAFGKVKKNDPILVKS